MGLVIVVLALFGWLAWSRYLHHKELVLLQEKGGNWSVLLETSERWRIRWGILAGIIMVLLGGAFLFGMVLYGVGRIDTTGRVVFGEIAFLLSAVGLAVLVAHVIWGRGQRKVTPCADKEHEA